MADTPNHNYNVPDQGDQDWHQPLNENFEEFEVDIELRDQESNLGDYTPTDGAKFLATDTGVVYLGDGSNWNVAFVAAEYDDSAGTATISQTLVTSELEVGTISGSLTGGTSLNNIAGNNLSIDSNGTLNASGGGGGGGGGISSLTGGDGIEPGSIGDGDTLSVAWGDANDLDGSGNLTGGYWTPNNNLLEPADSNIDGIDVDVLTCSSTIDAGGLNVGSGNINGDKITGRVITARDGVLTQEISSQGAGLGIGTSNPSASLDVNGDVDADDVATPSINANGDALGIGTDSPSTPLDVQGQSNWNLDNNDGDFRIGNDNYRLSMGVALGGGGAGNAAIRAKGGDSLKLGAGGSTGLTVKDYEIITPFLIIESGGGISWGEGSNVIKYDDSTGQFTFRNDDKALLYLRDTGTTLWSDLDVNGDLDVSGNKNFVQSVDTDDGEKEIVYTSTEAPTARTEATGVANLEDGCAAVELPEHFGWVTDDDEPIHVQTTPHSADSGGLAAVERTSDRLVIEDRDGDGDYEFSYTVKGTRDGYADKEVVREPTARDSAEPSQSASPADD